jgi:hypothetical protein
VECFAQVTDILEATIEFHLAANLNQSITELFGFCEAVIFPFCSVTTQNDSLEDVCDLDGYHNLGIQDYYCWKIASKCCIKKILPIQKGWHK